MFVLRQQVGRWFTVSHLTAHKALNYLVQTLQPFPADTFQRTPITQNAPHPTNIGADSLHCYCHAIATPFNSTEHKKIKHKSIGFTQLKGKVSILFKIL